MALVAVPLTLTAVGTLGALVAHRADRRGAYRLAKGLAPLGFVGTAIVAGATGAAWSTLVLFGLALAACGDLALAGTGKRSFIAGMGFFALAYALYSAAFTLRGFEPSAFTVTAPAAVFIAGAVWTLLRAHVPAALRLPIAVYLVIIGSMLATGVATAVTHRAWMLGVGVALVVASDIAVARERFVSHAFINKLLGLPAYYVGQTLIALSLGQ